LAIRLAIQITLEEYNLLIVDEPCQHLDESSGKIFRDILTDIGKKSIKQSIIFTYNQDFLKGDWNNIVQLTEE
jgi:DNA repair exonuclease SbcCD ATPase subunit